LGRSLASIGEPEKLVPIASLGRLSCCGQQSNKVHC
jgi:hypothetical protein